VRRRRAGRAGLAGEGAVHAARASAVHAAPNRRHPNPNRHKYPYTKYSSLDTPHRVNSAYTDADDDSSLAASDFESGAEDLESDDEAAGGTGARTLAEDLAAVRIGGGGGGRGGDARGDGRGAAATSSTGIDREAQAAFEDDEIQEAFAAFDEDGDGLLDVNDVQSFFDALGESLTLYEVAELIKMVDGDGDGMVNFDEFFDLATRSARFFEQGG